MPPNYALADQPVSIQVANVALPALVYLARGAGMNNYTTGGAPNPDVQKYMLGFAVRFGLKSFESIQSYGQALTQRFDTRFGSAVTATDALLFADDIALASSFVGIFDVSIAKIYRTAAQYFFATYDTGLRDFFVPTL